MIRGTVTRATGAVLAPAQQTTGNAAAYVAVNAAGVNLGFFPTAAAAQKVVQTLTNNNQPLRWAREDLLGDVENWVGRDQNLDPREIWGDSLRIWVEMDAGVFIDSTTGKVRKVGNRVPTGGSYEQAVAVSQPNLVAGPGGKPALSYTPPEVMPNRLVTDPEFTVMVVLSRAGALAIRTVVDIATFASVWELGVDGAGRWTIRNGGIAIAGPASVVGVATQVSAEQDSAGARLFVNAALGGGNPTAAVGTSATTEMSDSGTPWEGLVSAVIIADEVAPLARRQTELYLRNRYGTPSP